MRAGAVEHDDMARLLVQNEEIARLVEDQVGHVAEDLPIFSIQGADGPEGLPFGGDREVGAVHARRSARRWPGTAVAAAGGQQAQGDGKEAGKSESTRSSGGRSGTPGTRAEVHHEWPPLGSANLSGTRHWDVSDRRRVAGPEYAERMRGLRARLRLLLFLRGDVDYAVLARLAVALDGQ